MEQAARSAEAFLMRGSHGDKFSGPRRDDLAAGSPNRRFGLGLRAWQRPRSYFNKALRRTRPWQEPWVLKSLLREPASLTRRQEGSQRGARGVLHGPGERTAPRTASLHFSQEPCAALLGNEDLPKPPVAPGAGAERASSAASPAESCRGRP